MVILILFPAAGLAEDIRDVKPPVNFPADYSLFFFILGCIFLAVLFFFLRYWSQRLKEAEKIVAQPDPPWVTALRRMEKLESRHLPQAGQFKEFYTDLSAIIRQYMEGRFNINAPEMTTEEFLSSLKHAVELNAEHQRLLQDFLNSSDMVKFAKYGPSVGEAEKSFVFARRLVEETKKEGTDEF